VDGFGLTTDEFWTASKEIQFDRFALGVAGRKHHGK